MDVSGVGQPFVLAPLDAALHIAHKGSGGILPSELLFDGQGISLLELGICISGKLGLAQFKLSHLHPILHPFFGQGLDLIWVANVQTLLELFYFIKTDTGHGTKTVQRINLIDFIT